MSETTGQDDGKTGSAWPIPPRIAIALAAAVVLFVLLGAFIAWIVPAALAAGLVTAAAGYIAASRVTGAPDMGVGVITPPSAFESRVEQALKRLDAPAGQDRIRAAHELQRVAIADPSRATEVADILRQHLENVPPSSAEGQAIIDIVEALEHFESGPSPTTS